MRFMKVTAGLLAAVLFVPVFGMKANASTKYMDFRLDGDQIHDEYFREYLTRFDTNSNGILDGYEINDLIYIDLRGYDQITSVAGIEYFRNLEKVFVSGLYKLDELNLEDNQEVTYIDASNSGISNLNIPNCSKLKYLDVHGSNLTSLNMAASNQLTYLDVSNAQIEKFNIRYNTVLRDLYENVQPVKKYGNNNKNTIVHSAQNPEPIESFPLYLAYDSNATVDTGCPDGYVDLYNMLPQSVIDAVRKYDVGNDGFFSQEEINSVTELKIRGLDSVDCLEVFPNLEILDVDYLKKGQLKSFDGKHWPKLKKLKLYRMSDPIETEYFSVSGCPDLEVLDLNGIEFKDIDLSSNLKLEKVYIRENCKLETFDVSKNINLKRIDLSFCNSLGSLDFSKNTNLEAFACELYNYTNSLNYKIESIILPDCLKYLFVANMPALKDLDVSHCKNLQTYELVEIPFDKIDLSNNPKLGCLILIHTNVSEVDISNQSTLIRYYNEGAVPYIYGYPGELDQYYNPSSHFGMILPKDIVVRTEPKPTATPVPTKTPAATTSKIPTSAPTSAPGTKPTAAPTSKPGTTNNPTAAPAKQGVTNTPSATTVPGLTNKPTATPTPKPSKPQTGVSDKAGTVEDFAERLYTTCLGREAEKAGKDYWVGELKAGKPGSEVAQGFFFSPEFIGFNLDNEEYITRLYRTFMGREPDKDGMNYWLSEMKNGQGRVFVFDGFVNSPEWADICLTYGIRSGGLAEPTFEKQATPEIMAFAERLYTTCLGRDAEPEGLKYWAQELANLRQTGTVAASGFFNSPEFIGLNTSDDEYVTRLYKTFMGREPEKAGFEFWTSELKDGKDRQYVFDGFSVAPEFANLCADAGIMR